MIRWPVGRPVISYGGDRAGLKSRSLYAGPWCHYPKSEEGSAFARKVSR